MKTLVAAPAFIVSSAVLANALKSVKPAVNGKLVPVLENVHFSAVDGMLTVTAFDLQNTIQNKFPVECRGDFSFLVPFKASLDLLTKLEDQPITITQDPENYKVTIKTEKGIIKLTGEDVKDYPRIPAQKGDAVTLPWFLIQDACKITQFASNDELRPAMTGVKLNLNGEFSAAATDGHRLVWNRETSFSYANPVDFIVPAKAMNILKGIKTKSENCTLRTWSNDRNTNVQYASFEVDNITVTTKVIDERYPDFVNVIPEKPAFKVSVDAQEVIGALKFALLTANKFTHQVIFTFGDKQVKLTSEDMDNDTESETSFAAGGSMPDFRIAFNAHFLIELLQNYKGEVVFGMDRANRAAVITQKDNGLLSLCMPVMIDPNK